MPQFKKVRLINPRRRKAKASGTRRRRKNKFAPRRPSGRGHRKNPAGEELLFLANPRKKRSRNSRKRNPFVKASRKRSRSRRRSNPFRRYHSRRRSNPVGMGAKSFAIEGTKAIVAGAVSAVGTRALVQMALKDKNTGMMGYLSNILIALGGGYALWKFTKSYSIAIGWATGGAASTVQRIWSEKVSMTSPAAAAPQLGDLDYSSNGLGGVGLSGFVNSGFAIPSVTDGGGVVQAPFQPQLPAVSAAAGSQAGPVAVPPNTVVRFAPRY